MSLNSTPSSDRLHIAFFGKRNAGKSSLVNAVTSQNLAIVSDIKGTTTDPVLKAMEILPLGPVMIIDTAGIDDDSCLGELRIKRTYNILNKTDIAVLVVDCNTEFGKDELELIDKFKQKEIPYIIAKNKADLFDGSKICAENEIFVSAKTGENINELREFIAQIAKPTQNNKRIIGHLLNKSDIVILVIPIDSAAPKGRLILPQQQTIRDILDSNAVAVSVQETELTETLSILKNKVKMVITDSQAFKLVNKDTPTDIPLTSFSILFANYKGNLETSVKGVLALEKLKDGDTILISEGCTHHRQCNDIGSVKLPKWISEYTGKKLNFEFTSGTEFPEELSKYSLIVHCGGCMLNEREMKYRLKCAFDEGIPITNYGILIAYVNGILKRSVEIFPEIYRLL